MLLRGCGEQPQPLVLDCVGVLILVDQDVVEALRYCSSTSALGAEDVQHVQQQVAEVAGVERLQPRLVERVELGAAAVGVGLVLDRIDLIGSPAAVLPAVDQPGELARRPALLVELGGGDQLLEQAQLVVGIDDRVVRLQPDQLGVAAQHLGRDRVEGAEPRHALDRAARQRADPLAHFARGLVGEGDAEDLARPGLLRRDEISEAGGQRGGLAGAGAGQHQHRPLGGQHGLALRRVQAVEEREFGRNCNGFRHREQLGNVAALRNKNGRDLWGPGRKRVTPCLKANA